MTTASETAQPDIVDHAILAGDIYRPNPSERGTDGWNIEGLREGDHSDSGLKAQAYRHIAIAGTDGLTGGLIDKAVFKYYSTAYFELNGDGFLVLDRNSGGTINDISKLFGRFECYETYKK